MRNHKARVILFSLFLLMSLLLSGQTQPSSVSAAAMDPARWLPHSVASGKVVDRVYDGREYALYLPTTTSAHRPLSLLLAFYGMGGNAVGFAASLAPLAEENGWLLLVPQLDYGDWKDIEALKKDDREQMPWLSSLVEALPLQTGLAIRERILLYGFSRGAQAAHRFAIMHPGQVLALAAMSAGTYTLPLEKDPVPGQNKPYTYPLGVSDLGSYCGEGFHLGALRKVAVWVGVGALDSNPGDVSRPWDSYQGTNRVDRARTFVRTLSGLGVQAQLDILPNQGHCESAESHAQAMSFLKSVEIESLTLVSQGRT